MARKQRKEINVFNMSFLDAVCCGFGAIIILFVLSKGGEPQALEQAREDQSGLIKKLEQEVHDLRGETSILNRALKGKREQLSEHKERLARLQGDLSELEGEFSASTGDADVQNTIEGKLALAHQKLTEEMKRLLANIPSRTPESPVGGIPVDSEYIIFVIDTSGSMKQYAWPLVQKKFKEILEIYPKVKGIQVMNDMGTYMFSQYSRQWIPDTPSRRKAILKTLRNWNSFSNSSPVEGIRSAINTFYAKDKKISIYVFGDEFSGSNMQPVINEVERVNKANKTGERLVRIHAIGFPVLFQSGARGRGNTGVRFATLMRALCEENGGAFVGLNSLR